MCAVEMADIAEIRTKQGQPERLTPLESAEKQRMRDG